MENYDSQSNLYTSESQTDRKVQFIDENLALTVANDVSESAATPGQQKELYKLLCSITHEEVQRSDINTDDLSLSRNKAKSVKDDFPFVSSKTKHF